MIIFKTFKLNDLVTVKVFKGTEEDQDISAGGGMLHIYVYPNSNPAKGLIEEYSIPMSEIKSLLESDEILFATEPGAFNANERTFAKIKIGSSRDKDNDEFLKWLFVERLHGNLDGLKEIPGCMYKKGNGIKGLINAEFVRLNND